MTAPRLAIRHPAPVRKLVVASVVCSNEGYYPAIFAGWPSRSPQAFAGTPGTICEYAWEVGDDTLTIWGGYVGSPASFKGTFSADGNSNTGCWEWPGGGYESTMTRVASE
jgi:hypothetical protein